MRSPGSADSIREAICTPDSERRHVMSRKFFVGVDASQNSLQALENLGALFRASDVHFHLFHAVPESSFLYPGELSTLSGEPSDWEKVQKTQAQKVLDQAVSQLVQMGYKRSRLEVETGLKSVNPAQDILEAGERGDYEAIVLARKGHSTLKRFILGTTASMVCQYADKRPVWIVGTPALDPPRALVALDESGYAQRTASHVAANLALNPEAHVTLLHIMPAKPPGYWDDGHILDEAERSERQALVDRWRSQYEEKMADIFARAKEALEAAGIAEDRVKTKVQTMMRGIARDTLVELERGDYNILAFGRRGTSAAKEFNLGSRAGKLLQGAPDCTLVLVN